MNESYMQPGPTVTQGVAMIHTAPCSWYRRFLWCLEFPHSPEITELDIEAMRALKVPESLKPIAQFKVF
jgi:hypothetical protein